ncbi:MAG: hypothetical protein JXR36_00300 [Bacteroidales bacterium]|nr:hypothetical protein [Bacteroidales bacterium]
MRKNLFFVLAVLCSITINAQEVDVYLIPENVETLMQNNENVFFEPILYEDIVDFPGISETDRRFGLNQEEQDIANSQNVFTVFDLDAEFGWSKTSKYVNIPLSYYYKNFEMSLKMPFYFQRRVLYSHGYVSAYGLGDLVLSAAWKFYKPGVYNHISANLSFPTGNQNKNSDGYLCPLGTGSYDLIFTDRFQFNQPKYSINAILTYRYSGDSQRKVIISYPDLGGTETINYYLNNGHTVVFNSSYNHYITNFFSVFGGLTLMKNISGDLSREQICSWNPEIVRTISEGAYREFFIFDAKLATSVNIYATDVVLVMTIPIYTDYKTQSVSSDRKIGFYLKLSRNIF